MSRRPRACHPPGRFAFLLALLPLTLSIQAVPALAQTPPEKIREFAATASGFTLRESLEEGSLQAGRQMAFPAELSVGVDYMVVGFCDSDCTDLDMSILDPSGEEIGNDYLPDAQPMLIVTPEVRGTYQIQVEMVSCSVEPCRFAVGIMESELDEQPQAGGGDIQDRLSIFRSNLAEEGYTEVGSPETGSLNEGQEIRFTISLTQGLEYKLAGVCDNDCDDLDLMLYGPSGEEVASDLLSDPIPLLSVAPTAGGDHRVAVVMVNCTVEPCGFMVSTFVKGGGIGPGGVAITGSVVLEEAHRGTLEAGDQRLREGEYFDEYTIQAVAGQTIMVDLRSPDFDTYLILETPGGEQERNDDWGDDTMHSHIEMIAPETGTYSVLVTTFLAEESGEYTLQVAVVEGS
jgi:hypothetical protein